MPVGSRVVLEIVDPEEDTERKEMLLASGALLERAYGTDEPDYSDQGQPL